MYSEGKGHAPPLLHIIGNMLSYQTLYWVTNILNSAILK